MGWFGDTSSEEKVVDTTGNVNNNVVIEQSVPIHNIELGTILYIICIIKIIELLYILFKAYNKVQKKKYVRRGISMHNVNNINTE